MVDNNITMWGYPFDYHPNVFNESTDPAFKKLAETYHLAETWDEYDNDFQYHIFEKGTHAYVYSYIEPDQLKMGRWWRSTEHINIGLNPYGGWRTRRNWYLNEVHFTTIFYEYDVDIYFIIICLSLGIHHASNEFSRGILFSSYR